MEDPIELYAEGFLRAALALATFGLTYLGWPSREDLHDLHAAACNDA